MMSPESRLQVASEPIVTGQTGFRLFYISLLSVVVGLVAGVAAWLLFILIAVVSNLVFYQTWSTALPVDLQNHLLGNWILIVPALGGLVVGLLTRYGTPKIAGHGIPEAMEAVLLNRSRISPRVAIFKPVGTAVAIGTGGPFGSEGPVIQMGGALGSMLGQLLHVTAAERKVLLACGAAAGMAATFSTPISAVIFAIELLLFEFRSRSFIPLVIAGTLATAVRMQLMGPNPLFEVVPAQFDVAHALPFYALFGLICGLAAVGFSKAFYWVEDLFEKLPIDKLWWPAIGGIGLGIIGYFYPRVLGVGYQTITDTLDGRLALGVLLSVMVFKSLALLVSLGSGTAGGLLAPMFTAGAALGGAFALVMNMLFPALHLSPGAFALVGMAAVFAAASRATFTFIIFAFEITRNYESILPLMLTCVVATAIALRLSRTSIMTERLSRRGVHVPQEYEADVFHQVRVGDVMEPVPATIGPEMTVMELATRMGQHSHRLAGHHAFPVVNASGRLVGIITRGDVLRSLAADPTGQTGVLDAGSRELIVVHPDETIHDALEKMLESNVGRLPVVSHEDPHRMVGFVRRATILSARRKRQHEERVVEKGWWRPSLRRLPVTAVPPWPAPVRGPKGNGRRTYRP